MNVLQKVLDVSLPIRLAMLIIGTTVSLTAARSTTSVPMILTFAGAGPIRLAMTLEEARQAVSRRLTRGEAQNGDCYYFLDQDASVGLLVRSGRVVRLEVADPYHATLSGLRAGDTEQRARQLYAGKYELEDHTYIPGGHYLTVRSKGRRALLIETDGRVVTRLRIGLTPAVHYPDGCL